MRVALALAALASAFAGALPPAIAACVLAPTFLLAPGFVAVAALGETLAPEHALALALALSPFLAGAPLAALDALGVPLRSAARGFALAIALLALVVPAPRRPAPAWDGAARAAFAAALGWALLVAAAFAANPALAPRSDGWFHAAVARQLAARPAPPEDPYFAGLRLLYFWGADLGAAAWLVLAPRLAVWTPFVAFNVAAALAVVLTVGAHARRMGAAARGVALAAALATLAYAPCCWLRVAARVAFGAVTGWAELRRTVASGLDPLLVVLGRGLTHVSMVFFGDKFLVLTQFGLGLALFLLAVLALEDLAERVAVRAGLRAALLVAAALFVHTVVGYAIVLVAAVSVVWTFAGRPRSAWTFALAAGAATLGALIVLSPYLLETARGKRDALHPGFSMPALATLFLSGACYVLPGVPWLGARLRAEPRARFTAAAVLVALVLALVLRLPQNNQSKFLNLAFLALAAPAASGLQEAWRRLPRLAHAWAVAALAVAVLPTSALLAWGAGSEREPAGGAIGSPSPDAAAAMRWAREHTPADAAFCDLGGGRELLALAGRSVLWAGREGERDWGYAPAALQARRELVGALVHGREPDAAGAALLRSLHRDVIVLARAAAPDSLSDGGALAAQPARFTLLWRNASFAFWRVHPS